MPVNMLNIAIPLTRRRGGRRAEDRVFSGRRDKARARAMALDNPSNRIAVIGAVAHERDDGFTHLAQQRFDVSGVVHIPGREIETDDLTSVGVEADMQLRPGSAPCRAVLFDLPFRSTAEPQAGAVDDQMHGFPALTGQRLHHQAGCPAAEGGIVRDRQIDFQQLQNRYQQTFGLPQGKTKDDT